MNLPTSKLVRMNKFYLHILLILFSYYVIEMVGILIFDNQKWRQKS